jgi:hypothetical protein
MATAGRENVLKVYSVEAMCSATLAVYRQIASANRQSTA